MAVRIHRETLLVAACCAALAACAKAKPAMPLPTVDLTSARLALATARAAGADEHASEAFARAEGHLNEAEALAADPSSPDRRQQAEWLGRLATVEAGCALQLARHEALESDQRSQSTQELERYNSQIRRFEEERRRLESRIALLNRELEFTETEVIRTKARLKGIETKADASSAIAETHILLGRLIDERGGRSQEVQRAQEALQRAEALLREENFGAAIFFAQKAQDAVVAAHESHAIVAEPERRAPKSRYTVRVASANLRGGPGTSEPIVGRVSQGNVLQASVVRGDWIRVEHGALSGWIHRSLVE